MVYKVNTADVEKEHGVGGGGGKGEWFEIKEGGNRMRLLTPHAILVSHFSQSGYKGVCIGKDHNCPGCARDTELSKQRDELLAQKTKEGDDAAKKVRLTRNVKYLYWVIDREDQNHMKLFKMPHTVAKQLEELQNNPEYTFDDMPMPYDITLNAKGAGKQTVEYSITPARANTPLTGEEETELARLKSPENIVDMMKDKKKKELSGDPAAESQINTASGPGIE